jgi:putative spermidine/putrescine transport system permease protein
MATREQVMVIHRTGVPTRQIRRYLTLFGLLLPALSFLLLVFVAGMLLMFTYSFYQFTGMQIEKTLTLDAYRRFFTDPFYFELLKRGFRFGFVTTGLALLVGYPTAYAMSRTRNQKLVLAMGVVIFSPLLTSIIVRAYGWLMLLGRVGLVNYVLVQLGVIDEPVRLLFNFFGVVVGMFHSLMPYAVFPVLSVLTQMDPALKEAAADLGANRLRTFWHVTLPLSVPGLLSAFQLTFVLTMTAFVTPRLLGGGRVLVMPMIIYDTIGRMDWPISSVMSIVLLLLVLAIIFTSNQLFKRVYSVTGLEG